MSYDPTRTGTSPAAIGYKRCHRCNVWRRPEGVREVMHMRDDGVTDYVVHQCSDDLTCTMLARIGKGELTGSET